jgi:hypothetical protein
MRLLAGVIDGNERIEALPIHAPRGGALLIVKGTSGRLYRIAVTDATGTAEDVSIVVSGATRRTDIVGRGGVDGRPVANLCLHTEADHLPLGDRVVALAMSLADDRETAMRIPLVAQFIAASREMLVDIGLFTDHGPMPADPFMEPPFDLFEEEPEDAWEDEALHDAYEQFVHEAPQDEEEMLYLEAEAAQMREQEALHAHLASLFGETTTVIHEVEDIVAEPARSLHDARDAFDEAACMMQDACERLLLAIQRMREAFRNA